MRAVAAFRRLSPNSRGIVLMTLGMGGFAVEDMFVKLASATVPPGQIILTLGVGGAIVLGSVARRQGARVWSRAALGPAVIGRNLSEMVGTFGYVLAISLSPLVVASAIFQAMPLAVTMGAALFLAERVGWRRWAAIGVGFAGVIIVIRPGAEGFAPASLLAVLAVVGLAARDLFTRRIPASTNSLVLATWGFMAISLVGAAQVAIAGGAVLPGGADALWLLGALAFGTAGYWTLTEATRVGELSAVMPFRYARLLFAILIGVAVFDERPDAWTMAGSILIIASGLYAFTRERRRARAAHEGLPTLPANV